MLIKFWCISPKGPAVVRNFRFLNTAMRTKLRAIVSIQIILSQSLRNLKHSFKIEIVGSYMKGDTPPRMGKFF